MSNIASVETREQVTNKLLSVSIGPLVSHIPLPSWRSTRYIRQSDYAMPLKYVIPFGLLAIACVVVSGCNSADDNELNRESSGRLESSATTMPGNVSSSIFTSPATTGSGPANPDKPTVTLPVIENLPDVDGHYRDTTCIDALGYTKNRFGKYLVKWSPDGSYILFNVNAEDYFSPMDLYYATADGLRIQKIIDGSVISPNAAASGSDGTGGTTSSGESVIGPTMYFDLSPDGARVVYSTCIEYEAPENSRYRSVHRYNISVVNVDGAEHKPITESDSIDIFPEWSPDGSEIAFISNRHRSTPLIAGRLVIYTVSTGELRDVPLAIGDRVAPYAPAWSPDGRTMAFVAYEGDIDNRQYRSTTLAVYTIGTDGSDLTRVSTTLTRPSWSPDGRRLAFYAPFAESPGFYSFAADGSEAVLIATLPADIETAIGAPARYLPLRSVEVSWAPDGAEILLDSLALRVVPDGSGTVESVPVSFNAGSPRQTRNGASGSKPGHPRIAAWSPDGSKIAVGATTGIPEDVLPKHLEGPGDVDVVVYTIDRNGADPQTLVRKGVTLVAESGWQDHNASIIACSAGYVVSEPENNPGLVEDCKTLIRSRGELGGGVALNWGPGVPIEEWTGITVEPVAVEGSSQSPARRVTRLIIGWPRWPSPPQQDYFLRLKGSIPKALAGLDELQILDLRRNQLGGRIPAALSGLENLRSLRLAGNSFTGCIPAELQTFGTTLSNGVGLPYCE